MKKLIMILITFSMIFTFTLSVSAESEDHSATVIIDDQANLLTPSQRSALADYSVIADFPFTVVISTVDSLGYQTPKQFANNRYDELCNSKNGILLLVAMESRDWYILTVGEVYERISVKDVGDRFLSDLSDGRYYQAFDVFLTGLPNDLRQNDSLLVLMLPIGIGLIAGLVAILIMRSRMHTAKPQHSATCYVKSGSYDLKKHLDFYLYSTVTKTPRPKNTSSGGGGGSRGGGGGKF